MSVFRWGLVVPGAICLGYLAYLVLGTLNRVSIILYTGAPLYGWETIEVNFFENLALGAVTIFFAVRIAPSAPRTVAIISFALIFGLSCISVWSSFMMSQPPAYAATAGLIVGAFTIAQGAVNGLLEPATSLRGIFKFDADY